MQMVTVVLVVEKLAPKNKNHPNGEGGRQKASNQKNIFPLNYKNVEPTSRNALQNFQLNEF